MLIQKNIDPDRWEAYRLVEPALHHYAFGHSWILFQAKWHGAEPLLLHCRGQDETTDIFAGIATRKRVWAGPMGCPGGCLKAETLKAALKAYPGKMLTVHTARRFPFPFDTNFELMISLDGYETVEQYLKKKASENVRRNYRKASRSGLVLKNGRIGEFHDCYRELCTRKKIRHPLQASFFEQLFASMKNEIILKSAFSGKQLLGSALLFVTPSQIHNYFILVRSSAFNTGLGAYLYVDMVREALERGKSSVNLGPSAPWDGTFEFKRRTGAVPVPFYTYQLSANLINTILFLLKSKIKTYKSGTAFLNAATH